jgi:hypothetical protein
MLGLYQGLSLPEALRIAKAEFHMQKTISGHRVAFGSVSVQSR